MIKIGFSGTKGFWVLMCQEVWIKSIGFLEGKISFCVWNETFAWFLIFVLITVSLEIGSSRYVMDVVNSVLFMKLYGSEHLWFHWFPMNYISLISDECMWNHKRGNSWNFMRDICPNGATIELPPILIAWKVVETNSFSRISRMTNIVGASINLAFMFFSTGHHL